MTCVGGALCPARNLSSRPVPSALSKIHCLTALSAPPVINTGWPRKKCAWVTRPSCAPGMIVRSRRFSKSHTETEPPSPPTAIKGSWFPVVKDNDLMGVALPSWVKSTTVLSYRTLWITTRPLPNPTATVSSAGDCSRHVTAAPSGLSMFPGRNT